jgi:hypothetical protein
MTARFDLIGVDEEVVSEGLGVPFNFNLIMFVPVPSQDLYFQHHMSLSPLFYA